MKAGKGKKRPRQSARLKKSASIQQQQASRTQYAVYIGSSHMSPQRNSRSDIALDTAVGLGSTQLQALLRPVFIGVRAASLGVQQDRLRMSTQIEDVLERLHVRHRDVAVVVTEVGTVGVITGQGEVVDGGKEAVLTGLGKFLMYVRHRFPTSVLVLMGPIPRRRETEATAETLAALHAEVAAAAHNLGFPLVSPTETVKQIGLRAWANDGIHLEPSVARALATEAARFALRCH